MEEEEMVCHQGLIGMAKGVFLWLMSGRVQLAHQFRAATLNSHSSITCPRHVFARGRSHRHEMA